MTPHLGETHAAVSLSRACASSNRYVPTPAPSWAKLRRVVAVEIQDLEAGQVPVMVLPTSGALGGRTLADGAIRGMKSLRQAAVEAGANSVVGLRTAPYITRNGNPRIFVYGTLANCE